ncbi:tetratricopeptide repeat protein [Magnetovibrio sp. PR-2]|uniref:tetratricopeptide repeat protein n=1 Tax=Magnetovibrio sp. PR-2 TaxID=3120356 RepID=UPI002FCE5913
MAPRAEPMKNSGRPVSGLMEPPSVTRQGYTKSIYSDPGACSLMPLGRHSSIPLFNGLTQGYTHAMMDFRSKLLGLLLCCSLVGGCVEDSSSTLPSTPLERGLALYFDKDYQAAKPILLPLAEAGEPMAMHAIGYMHDFGLTMPKDPSQACDWYEKAAQADLAKSMYSLARCYHFGKGRKPDDEQLHHWLLKAANHGHIRSMINLAGMDETEGETYRFWMNRAVQAGSKFAAVDLWFFGYENDVPGLRSQDIVCNFIRITLFGEDIDACDDLI